MAKTLTRSRLRFQFAFCAAAASLSLATALFAAVAPAYAISESGYAGANMYETAVAEARAAYPQGSSSAIIVGSGDAWADALSAAGLAASRGPILYTEQGRLQSSTAQALGDLGVKSVVVVGGTAAISQAVIDSVSSMGIVVETRLAGDDCYGTQMAVYNHGMATGLWDGSLAIVATGTSFGDALSVSPVAYARKAPIFLVDSSGELSLPAKKALVEAATKGAFKDIVAVGGPAVISDQAIGFLDYVSAVAGGSAVCSHIYGQNQYETSSAIAQWAVGQGYLSWSNVAFASGNTPYDALAGSVLQGTDRSVLLLVADRSSSTIEVAAGNRNAIGTLRFFGGTATLSDVLRTYIRSRLGMYIDGVSLSMMCNLQYPELPYGCEAVALTNDLTYYGYYLSKFEIADRWLPRSKGDFVTAYQGNPYGGSGGWNSCCAPAIANAGNAYLAARGSSLRAYDITGTSFGDLYEYLEQGYPVIVWNTVDMRLPRFWSATQYYNGRGYSLCDDTHTVVLSGFNRSNGTVEVVDSLSGYVTRDAGQFSWIYAQQGCQAVVIR